MVNLIEQVKNEHGSKFGGVSYNSSIKCHMANADVLLIDENGKYYFEYVIIRNCDIIDSITVKMFSVNSEQGQENHQVLSQSQPTLCYYIGGIKLAADKISELITVAAMFTEFRMRVIFAEKPKLSGLPIN